MMRSSNLLPELDGEQRLTPPSPLVAMLLFIGLTAIYACFHHARDWNSATRLMLTFAIVQEGTIEITPFVASSGRLIENPQTRDLSSPGDGRFFCDKAPGHSFLAAIPYWLALKTGLVEPHPLALPGVRFWPADYWVTLGSSGLAAAATGTLLYWMCCQFGSAPLWAMATGLSYGIATNAFAYATVFYGHVTTAFFSLLSLWLMYFHRTLTTALLAGAASGFGVMIEYPQAVVPIVLFSTHCICSFVQPNDFFRLRRLAAFLIGGLPFAFALGYYHYLVTGSPISPPYVNEVQPEFAYHRQGSGIPLGDINLEVIANLLYGQPRGLLWHAAATLGAVPGLIVLIARKRWSLAVVIAAIFAGLLLINASFPAWDGGWATGPRFLLPSFPFLMLAAGVWLGIPCRSSMIGLVHCMAKMVWTIAAIAGAGWMTLLTVAGERFPYDPNQTLAISIRGYWSLLEQKRAQPHFGDWLLDWLDVNTHTGLPGLYVTTALITLIATVLMIVAYKRSGRASSEHRT